MGDQSVSGGRVQQDVGTRDDMKQATEGEDAGTTRDTKQDKVPRSIPTRADNSEQNA